jgi:signal peptidase I
VILRRFMKDVVLPVAVAIALAFLIQASVAKPYEIPTGSMIPTIQERDRVIANRVIYKFRDISRGDIIVFHPTLAARTTCSGPEGAKDTTPFVKRVIGLPGDHLVIEEGKREVLVNGVPLDVRAAALNPPQGPGNDLRSKTFDVPQGKLFVLGDNRGNSCDSHQWSDPYVPISAVIGQAEVTYWPLRHITFLR